MFFFKQKTAYEMRISDWSSDVCSSDLRRDLRAPSQSPSGCGSSSASRIARHSPSIVPSISSVRKRRWHATVAAKPSVTRSEEHTSEVQSLMRISSAVFCLTKKTNDIGVAHCNKADNQEE